MTSTPVERQAKVERVGAILTQGEVLASGHKRTVDILLDTGAEANFISQRLALELHLTRVPNAELPRPDPVGGPSLYCYGAYRVHYWLHDSWGQTRESKRLFYGVDHEGPPVILGRPGLRAEGIIIDNATDEWRMQITVSNLQLGTPEQFWESAKEQPYVYTVSLSGAAEDATRTPSASTAQTLPADYGDFADVFSQENAAQLPPHRSTDHAIDLQEGEPPHGPLYNLSATELRVLREYLDDSLAKGWIQHSTSPAGAPILFVPKKDGSLRLCVDYRGLNKVTIKNRHPLPLISEILDRLSGARYFTKLDLKDAYHRIRIREGDEWKTAFRTRYGHFEYTVMPFGLANAPATFQAYINKAVAGLADITCIVYLDDILIYADSMEDLKQRTREVLERLRKFQLYVNLKKCLFHTSTVEFLGFVISPAGVSMDPGRVTTIEEWPEPKSFREVQVFLGFTNFYRRFIAAYSKKAAPLTDLLKGSQHGKKSGPFEFAERERVAFRTLKDAFQRAPLLVHYDPKGETRLETDASGGAMAAIISQKQEDGTWHPVAFWSRKLTEVESRYETHDQELLAIVQSFKHWRHYCEGSAHPIEVLTDHNNLRGFMNVKELNGRQARWAMKLAAYDFTILHRPGKTNPADGPSRRPDYMEQANRSLNGLLPTLQAKLTLLESVLLRGDQGARTLLASLLEKQPACCNHSIGELRELQPGLDTPGSFGPEKPAQPKRDAAGMLYPVAGTAGCKQLVPRTMACNVATRETAYGPETQSTLELIKVLQQQDPQACEARAALGQKGPEPKAGRKKPWSTDAHGFLRYKGSIYVPGQAALREELIKRHHDDPLAGHFGAHKTEALLTAKYNWPGAAKEINEHVSSCDMCQRVRAPRHRPYGTLTSLPRPGGPWQELAMDFITGLPPSLVGPSVYDAILVIVDRFTKMAKYLPATKTITAVELAELFFKEIVLKYGMPKGIISDRGSVFTSEFWSSLCFHARVKRRLSTAFHPQTDGQTERQNQTLEHYLRTFCNEEQGNWAELLPHAEFAYNRSLNATIGVSPFFALMGYQPDVEYVQGDAPEGGVPIAAERVKLLQDTREKCSERWRAARATQERYYNQKHAPMSFNVGDWVMLSTKNLKQKRPSKKLSHKFLGPFRIRDIIGQQAYRLWLPAQYKRIHDVFHVSLLEPYRRSPNDDASSEYQGPELVEDEEQWLVEGILAKRKAKGHTWYKVRWKGWTSDYDQWVMRDDIDEGIVRKFEATAPHQGRIRLRLNMGGRIEGKGSRGAGPTR